MREDTCTTLTQEVDTLMSRDGRTDSEESSSSWRKKGLRSELRDRLLTDESLLDDTELLQVIIHMACPDMTTLTAKATAVKAMEDCGSFGRVLQTSQEPAERISGLDRRSAFAIKVIAAAALYALEQKAATAKRSDSLNATLEYLHAKLVWQKVEFCAIICLNKRHHVISNHVLSAGTVNHCSVYPREIARLALRSSADGVVLVHNHPSGDPSPSRDDIVMTRQVAEALRVIDITLYNHVILASQRTFSFRREGLI